MDSMFDWAFHTAFVPKNSTPYAALLRLRLASVACHLRCSAAGFSMVAAKWAAGCRQLRAGRRPRELAAGAGCAAGTEDAG